MLTAFTLRAWSPVLESISDCVGAAIPTVLLPKIKLAGVSVATGPTMGWPEPGATLNAIGRPKPGAVKGEPLTSWKYPVDRSTEYTCN